MFGFKFNDYICNFFVTYFILHFKKLLKFKYEKIIIKLLDKSFDIGSLKTFSF